MSDLESGSTEQTLAARIGGTILLAIFAIPFAEEGAKRLFDGEYIAGAFAFLIAVVLAVAAILWASSNQIRTTFAGVATNPRWWIVILSVVLLYFGLDNVRFGQSGMQGPQGIQGPVGPVAPPDPRVEALTKQVAKLESIISQAEYVTQIRQLEICEARLAPLTKPLSELDQASRSYILSPSLPMGNGAAMMGPPPSQWNKAIDEIKKLGKECPLESPMDFEYKASDSDADTPCRDEPSLDKANIYNIDNIHRYRRFCHKADFEKSKVEQFQNYLLGRIGALEQKLVPKTLR